MRINNRFKIKENLNATEKTKRTFRSLPVLSIVNGEVLTGISRKIEDAPISTITVKTARPMKNQVEPEM